MRLYSPNILEWVTPPINQYFSDQWRTLNFEVASKILDNRHGDLVVYIGRPEATKPLTKIFDWDLF